MKLESLVLLSTESLETVNGTKRPQEAMNDHGSTIENATGSSSENLEGEVSKIQTLTQEPVNEQFRGFIASLTHQLEELTRLVQGTTTTRHPNYFFP